MNQKRVLLPMLAVLLAVAATASALAAATDPPRKRAFPKTTVKIAPRRHVNPRVTRRLRDATWRWQIVIGLRRAHSAAPLDTRRALLYWRRQARHVRKVAVRPPHKRGWLCIHHFEGSWRDGNDPYWGGLQMDRSFMRSYAPRLLLRRGWANRWTALEQMWVAERAHRSGRGYGPWPNTARYCGLL
ncbi:MAG: hypothetical protein M3R49_10645 [Chloroflexota bacterium]|nr:hypothetical protein [Chloroflexota bacterium]